MEISKLSKKKVTLLALLTVIQLNILIWFFVQMTLIYKQHASKYQEYHSASYSLEKYNNIGTFISANFMLINLLLIVLIAVFIYWLWGKFFSIEKLVKMSRLADILCYILFVATFLMAVRALTSIKYIIGSASSYFDFWQILVFSVILFATYFESILKTDAKSTIRKYLNIFYLFFSFLFWYDFQFIQSIDEVIDTHSISILFIGLMYFAVSFVMGLFDKLLGVRPLHIDREYQT